MTAFGIRPCPVCGDAHAVPWKPRNLRGAVVAEDLRITDARYGTTLALSRCNECDFVFADDASLPELERLYAALDDPAYDDGAEGRTLQHRFLLDLCRREQPGAETLLDVGAAAGFLVDEAGKCGLIATGIEPSRSLAERARVRGANVVTGTLPNPAVAGQRFDIVTLVDVIEHVADPVGLCRAAARHLSPGGLLVVVTPDVASLAARVLGRRWWHFRVAHVGYFSTASFSRAAERAGLTVMGSRRALWFFPLGYLLTRVTQYLPRAAQRGAGLLGARMPAPLRARLLDTVVPLNLFDSTIYFLRMRR